MGNFANPLGAFQDRIMRVPGITLPRVMADPAAHASYFNQNAGDAISEKMGMLGQHLTGPALALIRNVAGQWSKNKKNKDLMVMNEGAPAGAMQHELGHALLGKILSANPGMQNPGDEDFAYGISNPTGQTQIAGQPLQQNVVAEMLARLRSSRPEGSGSNMLSTADPNQNFVDKIIRLQMAGQQAALARRWAE